MFNVGEKVTVTGAIKKILWTANNGQSSIVTIKVDGIGEPIKAIGVIPNPAEGLIVEITGIVEYNEQYKSQQIRVEKGDCIVKISDRAIALINYLSSDLFKGIGESAARKMVLTAGPSNTVSMRDIIEKKDLYSNIPRLNQEAIDDMVKTYESDERYKVMEEIYVLTNGKITSNQANKIYNAYKKQAPNTLKQNPYKLAYDISGFGFTKVDTIAKNMGVRYDSIDRISAGLVYCLRTAASQEGHCYLPLPILQERALASMFSNKELIEIYYVDVLGADRVPTDTSEDWGQSVLRDLVDNHSRKIDNLMKSWSDLNYKNKAIKTNKLSEDDIHALDIFYEKKMEMMDKFDIIIKEAGIDFTATKFFNVYKELEKEENQDKYIVIRKNIYDETLIYEKKMFVNEFVTAKILVDLLTQPALQNPSLELCTDARTRLESEKMITLDMPDYALGEDQFEACFKAVTRRLSVITGGPGRGKTTIIELVIAIWMENGGQPIEVGHEPTIILLAPTGKAAKRMSEQTGHEAYTVDRYLLKFKDNLVPNDNTLIIFDETSMMDIFKAKWALSSLQKAQLCFVGDVDQLPSVGPGQVLRDLILSKKIPTTRLTTCYRNAGSILQNSDRINNGADLREFESDAHFQMYWSRYEATSADVANDIVKKYRDYLRKPSDDPLDKYKFAPNEMIVLVPMVVRANGVNALNRKLQDIANPKQIGMKQIARDKDSDIVFREGDRVIHCQNDYEIEVIINDVKTVGCFNGETGTITKIEGMQVIVTFDDDKVATYPFNKIAELDLAYALTYHKSQGSEYACVICGMAKGDYTLLTRPILYTGVSRAKQLCVLVGHKYAFQVAIDNKHADTSKRYTGLSLTIKEGIEEHEEIVSRKKNSLNELDKLIG